MYRINDVVIIIDNDIELVCKIVKINLDGTFEVLKDDGIIIRIYREDVKE